MLSKFEEFLNCIEQVQWDRLVWALAPEIHEVDRQATRIWYSIWPLKVTRLLQAGEPEAMIRDYRLKGRFRLEQQIDTSISFLYGAKYWSEVKGEIVAQTEENSEIALDLKDLVEASSQNVAQAAGVEASLTRGITAVGYLMAAHVGIDGLRTTATSPAHLTRLHQSKPNQICGRRRRQTGDGWLGFLRGAGRKFKVRADAHVGGGYQFKAYQGQDLSMASKSDQRDYTKIDPRRLEGPLPFECRSGSCGFCWVGVLSPPERLEKITAYEIKRLKFFGYLAGNAPHEEHPPIRLACQSHCWGDTQVIVPPWNGELNGRGEAQ